MRNKVFYSSGKLMLTGEYLVLDGASSISLPTKYGQNLEIIENTENNIKWESFNHLNKKWLDITFDNNLNLLSKKSKESLTLLKILEECIKLNPHFLLELKNKLIKTFLEFPNDWGLGSSSTLINNISSWARVSPFLLLKNTLGGSGYDIAVAKEKKKILYKLVEGFPVYQSIFFNPIFKDSIFFIHLNKKQNSNNEILKYKDISKIKNNFIEEINKVTNEILSCNDDINTFSKLLDKHEKIISNLLNIQTIKEQLFSDFKGTIKSLGAWGGDFILAIGEKKEITQYFKSKGYDTVLGYDKIIL